MEGLGPLIFIVIMVISVLNKLRKKPDEESPQPPGEIPDLDLPEILRKMLTGQTTVPKARPAAPKEIADDGWQPVKPVTMPMPQRRDTSYQPPVARPSAQRAPEAPAPVRPRPPVVVEAPVSRPAARPARAAAAPPTPPRARSAALSSVNLPLPTLRSRGVPQPAAKARRAAQAAPVQQALPAHVLLRNLDDVRRGIVLSEVLGPPISLR